jgi:hypothetical protein
MNGTEIDQHPILPSIKWVDVTIGAVALLLLLPSIFGGLGSLVPPIVRPGPGWPVETGFDRAFVAVYTWSVVLAMMSPPATVLGAVVGVWAVKRAGMRTAFGKTVLGTIGVATFLTAAFWLWMWRTMREFPNAAG